MRTNNQNNQNSTNALKVFGHVMIDIETMAKNSNSVIVSIGAIEFNMETAESGETFFTSVDMQSCLDVGLKVDADTVMWWMLQEDQARRNITSVKGFHIEQALERLTIFIRKCGGMDCQVWGNSNRFDLGILADAYNAVKKPLPWSFSKERDVRTLVSLKPEIKDNQPFIGVKHSPIDDCLHQIAYCSKIWNSLKR